MIEQIIYLVGTCIFGAGLGTILTIKLYVKKERAYTVQETEKAKQEIVITGEKMVLGLKTQIESYSEMLATMDKDLKYLNAELQTSRGELCKQVKINESLKKDHESLKKDHEGLKLQHADLTKKYGYLQRSYNTLKDKQNELKKI